MNGRLPTLILVCTSSGAGTGCASHRLDPAAQTGPDPVAEAKTALEVGDALWEGRGDPHDLAQAIASWQAADRAIPGDSATLARLAHAEYFAGWSNADVDAAEDPLQRAIAWADACEVLDPSVESARTRKETLASQLQTASAAALVCAYWGALARDWEGWSHSASRGLRAAAEVEPRMDVVEVAMPELDGYGTARWLGAHLARLPTFDGADLEASAAAFDQALALAPGVLEARLLRAETLDVERRDRAAFDQDVLAVLAADAAADSDFEPENRVVQERARALRSRREALFPPEKVDEP